MVSICIMLGAILAVSLAVNALLLFIVLADDRDLFPLNARVPERGTQTGLEPGGWPEK